MVELSVQVQKIERRIDEFVKSGKNLCLTSSFQTQSMPLLHIISKFNPAIPVLFLQTGYLFPETLKFRDRVARDFGLEIVNVVPDLPKVLQKDAAGRLLFASDPDACCHYNKVAPLRRALRGYDVWISGIRADQSPERSQRQEEEPGEYGILRYHPLLHWTARDIHAYRVQSGLPEHPLDAEGYISVGCVPCTAKFLDSLNSARDARWHGLNKTECGLHTKLVG